MFKNEISNLKLFKSEFRCHATSLKLKYFYLKCEYLTHSNCWKSNPKHTYLKIQECKYHTTRLKRISIMSQFSNWTKKWCTYLILRYNFLFGKSVANYFIKNKNVSITIFIHRPRSLSQNTIGSNMQTP